MNKSKTPEQRQAHIDDKSPQVPECDICCQCGDCGRILDDEDFGHAEDSLPMIDNEPHNHQS